MSLDLTETVKALGIHWDPTSDSILYSVNLPELQIIEPQGNLFYLTAQNFSTSYIGLLGPVIAVRKILIQQLWEHQLGWDDHVPPERHKAAIQFLQMKFSQTVFWSNSTITF